MLNSVLHPDSEARLTVFLAEAFGVVIFALYWIIKSKEIARSNSEQSAAEGKLSTREYGLADMFKQISVEHIEPLTKR
jgi:hypothetical protein